MDESAIKKLEDTIAIAKFAPKKDEVPTVDILLDQAEADLKQALVRIEQMREAWNEVAEHMIGIHRRINK